MTVKTDKQFGEPSHGPYKDKPEVTKEMFVTAVNREPDEFELDRCNCMYAGEYQHKLCGWCKYCKTPRFSCKCPKW